MSCSKERLIIVGARGLGRQLASFIAEESAFEILGFLDDATVEPKPSFPILGNVETWQVSKGEVYLVALGDPKWRRHYVDLLKAKGAQFATYISSRAIVGKDVQMGEGTMVCPGAIVTTNVSLGQHVLLNIATSISHDCRVGDFVTVSPGARATGNCVLADDVYMGVNSSLLPKVSLAMGITVGAGAVITKSYEEENLTLVGIPAKPLDKKRGNG
jgi:sugar O-acyltransferase (sialic acid O-acetyltransferase NeuD family)